MEMVLKVFIFFIWIMIDMLNVLIQRELNYNFIEVNEKFVFVRYGEGIYNKKI